MNADFPKLLLSIVVEETQKNLDRWGPTLSADCDLRRESDRRMFGALTPNIQKRLPHMSPSTVRNKLHQLKDAGLLEYYMPYQSTIRWFPVSLIPKP